MTPQEAKEIIKVLNEIRSKNLPCETPITEALNMAVEALEKQISKKPNIHGYREGRLINTISYTCPICNKHIGREDYCKHCGQKIDWSDTK
jgi:hypothetical protein